MEEKNRKTCPNTRRGVCTKQSYLAITGRQILSPEILKQALSPQLSAQELNALNILPSQASNDGGILFPGITKQWGYLGLLLPEGLFTGRGNGALVWGGLASDSWHTDVKKVL